MVILSAQEWMESVGNEFGAGNGDDVMDFDTQDEGVIDSINTPLFERDSDRRRARRMAASKAALRGSRKREPRPMLGRVKKPVITGLITCAPVNGRPFLTALLPLLTGAELVVHLVDGGERLWELTLTMLRQGDGEEKLINLAPLLSRARTLMNLENPSSAQTSALNDFEGHLARIFQAFRLVEKPVEMAEPDQAVA